MLNDASQLSDLTGLLIDLQRANEIAQRLSGCLEPEEIARRVTDGLVEKFDCAFARIWLVEPDRSALKLVASSGLYTRLDGSFARVPMGAFKVGKIAQYCIPFLSNQLAEESWVKDREWAIHQKICGFAGYPLVADGKVIGVLVSFSQRSMAAEFLQVLQGLCTTVAVSLENALLHQRQLAHQGFFHANAFLSEQLASILKSTQLILVGTERPVVPSLIYLFLRMTETLNMLQCSYCQLHYSADTIGLDAMVPWEAPSQPDSVISAFGEITFAITCLGGTLRTNTNQNVVQILLKLPYLVSALGSQVRIRCQSSIFQFAFTQLAYLAGLTLCTTDNPEVPIITDGLIPGQPMALTLWIVPDGQPVPEGIGAVLDLSVTPIQLRDALDAVIQRKSWQKAAPEQTILNPLTESEQRILVLLGQGLRDRDIAHHLCVSESTIKFHVRNILVKSKAKTRFQALYLSIVKGWLAA